MVDAACRVPGQANKAYIFSGTKYTKVIYTPGEGDSMEYGNPKTIQTEWKAFKSSDFGTLDTIVRVPNTDSDFYAFSGAKYMRLKLNMPGLSDTVVTENGPIEAWKTLARYGFDRIDAAMAVPGSKTNIYFFRGREWIDVSCNDDLISYGTIQESWPSLVAAGFQTIDAILPNDDHTYYVFSGRRYVRIKMEKDEDTIIGSVHDIIDWNSLKDWI